MLKYLISITLFTAFTVVLGQATIYSENFESGLVGWNSADDLTPNYWILGDCAGNGSSSSGLSSMYVTIGGVDSGCGPTGDVQYNYTNSPSGTLVATQYTSIDASCASDLQLSLDYRMDGVVLEDYGEIVYSTDGGMTWLPIAVPLSISSVWTSTTANLPSSLDFTVFYLGVRFYYNDAIVNGLPLAVDNILISGTDTVAPTMTCPLSVNLPVNSSCVAICDDFTKAVLTLSDNCTDSAFIALTQDIPEFTVFASGPGGTETIVVTATDEAGNTSQCSFTLNIVDENAPLVTCPADTNLYLDATCEVTLPDFTVDATASDNCSSVSNLLMSQSPVPGQTISGSSVITAITITVTDESGNFGTCQFNTETIDTILSTIICPADTTIFSNSSCQGTLSDYTGGAVVNDNCVPSGALIVSQSPIPGTTITTDQIITLTLSGGVPNIDQTCTFNGILIDTITPQIVCPGAINLYADNSCEVLVPDYTGAAIISDNCTVVPTVSQSPLPGSTQSAEIPFSITLTSLDNAGNMNQCQFIQSAIDTISPSIICPADQNEPVDANCFVTLPNYVSMTSSSDNCSGGLFITQNPFPGTTISANTAVLISVIDPEGNSSSCTFNVLPIDTISPQVICPPSAVVNTSVNCDYTLTDYTGAVSASDNCTAAGSLNYAQNPVSGTVLAPGIHQITIWVEDGNLNSGQCSFNLTVQDQTAPVINTCPPNQNLIADSNCTAVLGDYTGQTVYSDNCSSAINNTITQSPAPGSSISISTTLTFIVTDELGNSASCNTTAILVDTLAPEVLCPADQTVGINGSCEYSLPDLSGLVTGTDNCSSFGNMNLSQNPPAGSTQNGITPILMTLTDEGGNQSTCITTIFPDDNTAPTITCPTPSAVNNGNACDYVLPNFGTVALVLDNCSNYSIVQNPSPGTLVSTGVSTISLVVTDAGGNADQCSFDLSVFETEDPVIICPADISTCDPLITFSNPVFSDNCLVSLSQTDLSGLSSGMVFPVGITTLEFTAIDSSSNSQSCSFSVEILDFPSSANIVDDTLFLCNQNGTVINADPISSGSGLWTVESGQGNFNNQFANSTGVNNIGIGTNVYAWTVSSALCGTLSDTLVVLNYQQDLPASTQDTIYACSDGSVMLTANNPLYGNAQWTTNGSGVIADISSSNTTSTVSGGWQAFIWTIVNGTCPPSSDTLYVFAISEPEIQNEDTLLCLGDDQFTLNATAPFTGQNATWSTISGNAEFGTANSQQTVVSNFSFGTTLILYTLSHEVCGSTSDTISVSANLCNEFEPLIPTVITPGNLDGKNDVFEINYLKNVYPECRVIIFNRWGSVVYESVGYESPWNGTYQGELLPMGTYFYRIELNDGSGEILKGDISIIH